MKAPNNNTPPTGGLSAIFHSAAMNRVRTAFKLAAIYLAPPAAYWIHPFRHGRPLRENRSLFRALAATSLVLVGHEAIHGATGRLFPTGEDYLESQGLDPALARQLSDQTIRVRQHNWAGRLHAANDMPSAGVISGIMLINIPGQAHAIPNQGSLLNHALRYTPLREFVECPVMLQAPDVTARQMVSYLSGISPAQIERVQITDAESRLGVAFHEFRHCATDNRLSPTLTEGDADATGVLLLSRSLENPDIAKTFLYARALGRHTSSHDTALVMDAAMNDRPLPPDDKSVNQPTADVFALADMYARNRMAHVAMPAPLKTAIALQKVMDRHGDLLSPRAQRRAELYIEAVAYFMPTAWAKAQAMPLTPPNPAPR